MPKKFKQVHSEDALTIIVQGDKRQPEPTHLIVKVGGGHVEIARCSDGSYWIHLEGNDAMNVIGSRIEYDHETYLRRHEEGKKSIPPIEDQEHIKKIAIQVKGPLRDEEY